MRCSGCVSIAAANLSAIALGALARRATLQVLSATAPGTLLGEERMARLSSSSFLLQRLVDWGVERIYGYPGDGINGLIGALENFTEQIDFIQVRHEEMAAFMACAHAKFTGEIGVCMATSGPGAIHLLNGLYDAKWITCPFWRSLDRRRR